MQAQVDFSRLTAYDPSLYTEQFFRHGCLVWPAAILDEFPAFRLWQGTTVLKRQFAESFGIASPQQVFLASRSTQLVRMAAQLMFRQCQNVLTTDLNWPAWQSIVAEEAVRHQRTVTRIELSQAILQEQWSADDVAEYLLRAYIDHACDSIFLPATSNLGIQLPIHILLAKLRRTHKPRFIILDAAQSFCHLPQLLAATEVDLTITGCHKWLGASLPLGVAIAGSTLVAEQLHCLLSPSEAFPAWHDPLLMFTEQLCRGQVDLFSETVNVTPLFTANAALAAGRTRTTLLEMEAYQRHRNMENILNLFSESNWSLVQPHPSLRSGILLARSHNACRQHTEPESVRKHFHQQGIALSAYAGGLIRLSLPSDVLSQPLLNQFASSLYTSL